jgi:tellurite resistance protein TerB
MSRVLDTLLQRYHQLLERHRQRPFLKAAMAACAYVATAGGTVSLRERMAVDRVLETLDRLQVFDPHEGVDLFNEYVAALRASDTQGWRQVAAAVDAEVAQEPDKAALLVRICLAVSEGPMGVPDAECRRIRELCRHLGLEPCPRVGQDDGAAGAGPGSV